MKRRRKPVRRLPKVPAGTSTGTWEWEQAHSPYTFEGRMELLGKFTRGVSARRRRRRSRRSDRGRSVLLVAVVMAAAVAVAIVLALAL